MEWKNWDELPQGMRNQKVKGYYDILSRKMRSLAVKRIFDVVFSVLAIVILSPVMAVLAVMIKADSKGPVLFRQIRVTQYGREFRICKFRTMVNRAEQMGSQVTAQGDARVTKVGKMLRGCRLDELPQLFNILTGDMSFVGTRPEVPRFVAAYTEEMMATLLLPAGVTSEASIRYKDEDRLLENAENVDEIYIQKVLPEKMIYNLQSIRKFNLLYEFGTMLRTVGAVLKG